MSEKRKRSGNRSFQALGIPQGSVLGYRNDGSVTCRTVDDRNGVEYQGKPYTLSALARELKGCSVSGYQYFRYNGTLLCDIGKPVVKGGVEVAETGACAGCAGCDGEEPDLSMDIGDPVAEGSPGGEFAAL